MAQELIYTSARRGLKPGTSGFCTVAQTRGMLPSTVRVAESLSAYKRRSAEQGLVHAANPVVYSHHHCLMNGENISFLSRVSVLANEHTSRDNKLAHHIVLRPDERTAAGPAWVAMQDDTFVKEWSGPPRFLDERWRLPDGDNEPAFAERWEQVSGDAGWAGVLASEYLTRPERVVYLIFEPGMELLPLISEALALISAEKRWLITFSTYFTVVPAGMTCAWRCCLPDQPLLKDPRKTSNSMFLNLTRRMGEAPDGVYVQMARGERTRPAPASGPAQDTTGRARKAGHPEPGFVRMPNRHRQRIRMRPDDETGGESTQ